MQIGSGWCKGLKLATPRGLETRPTRSRVRAAIMSMLQPWFSEAVVLDLYAGSGAVGLEMLSRGAVGAVFIEKSKEAYKALEENIGNLRTRASSQGVILNPLRSMLQDSLAALNGCRLAEYDLIWADPPYAEAESFVMTALPIVSKILTPGGVFALESDVSLEQRLSSIGANVELELIKQRAYGVTLISVWKKLAD